ncbi:MAG: MFS transporter [Thiobacillus sp.]|jgi:MFS family permease|uniref:MFS transporter n=1 Tax=Thiobacillus sp. TaxID=924 RepID=UPI002895B42F|nr:MFS transporter [Thiobacillus sp.]MDT3707916.1 MFS transporter [Thiobacillus sp.]
MRALPKGVIALGLVSLFMDLSSEMIHSLLPVFLVTVLGATALSVGLIEGIAEATASITKVFSGVISDWTGRRKPLVLLGYGLAAITKPLFPLATGIGAVLTARFIDRIGKGIRGAPRDALIADITPAAMRGTAYGLRQSMDTVGAFAGPLLAMILMAATHDNFRLVFWVAVIPALVCVLLIIFGVEEPERTHPAAQARLPLSRDSLRRLPGRFWRVVAFAGILTLARFSEAFLLLRAENVGLAVTWVPMILIVMNVMYAASAYPFGKLSDTSSRRKLLAWGILLLIAADLILALAGNYWLVGLGAAVWGLHMGATQGLLAALVADTAPADLRGTAFGVFNLASGIALLAASIVAGGLWTMIGPAMTFYAGATFSAAALLALFIDGNRHARSSDAAA